MVTAPTEEIPCNLSANAVTDGACVKERACDADVGGSNGATRNDDPREEAAVTDPQEFSFDSLNAAEAVLMRHLAPGLVYEKRSVWLPSSGHAINTLSAGPAGAPTLVLVHGWGAGCAFLGKNIDGLAGPHRVHAIDWLGFGASSHPPFEITKTPEEAEAFFLDAFEEWTSEMEKLEPAFAPFHLCGHSLGGFLSVGFTLRCPNLVKNLVLASPVGVPPAPLTKGPPPSAPLLKRLAFQVIFALWDRHWTPQAVLRSTPEYIARSMISAVVTPRFPSSDVSMHESLVEYAYQLWIAPPSGERSLSTILESGAYARRPLFAKLPEIDVPVLFIYGDRDWMDSSVLASVRKTMKVPTDFALITNGGHHFYFENSEDFNTAVLDACAGMHDEDTFR